MILPGILLLLSSGARLGFIIFFYIKNTKGSKDIYLSMEGRIKDPGIGRTFFVSIAFLLEGTASWTSFPQKRKMFLVPANQPQLNNPLRFNTNTVQAKYIQVQHKTKTKQDIFAFISNFRNL